MFAPVPQPAFAGMPAMPAAPNQQPAAINDANIRVRDATRSGDRDAAQRAIAERDALLANSRANQPAAPIQQPAPYTVLPASPVVNVQAPNVSVSPIVGAPVVNVQSPNVSVSPIVGAPVVNVQSPNVSVSPIVGAPVVNVQAPNVSVSPIVGAPVVNVQAPNVNIPDYGFGAPTPPSAPAPRAR